MTNFVSPLCSAVTCAPDQFACKDGTCLATAKLCDGTSDCPEGDDENKTLCYPVLVTPPQPHFTTAVPTSGKEFIFILFFFSYWPVLSHGPVFFFSQHVGPMNLAVSLWTSVCLKPGDVMAKQTAWMEVMSSTAAPPVVLVR